MGCVFCCVVGLCPDNLREAWGTDTEWLLNIGAILFIYSRIPAVVIHICPFQMSGAQR